jgi:basic membrane protein A
MIQTRRIAIVAGIVGIVVSLLLVVTFNRPSAPNVPTENPQGLNIAFLTDASFEDDGWGEAGFSAMRSIEEKYGYQITYLDEVAIPDIESTLSIYAESDYDLIIVQGFQWGDPALLVAKQAPNTKFIVFTGLVSSENVASIFPMQQEGSYLLGVLAGSMTETNLIGYVGGDQYPNLINIFEGYKQGVKETNPDATVIGTYVGEWNNVAKGKEIALTQIGSGADFVLHVADISGHGVIRAAQERGVYAFGAVCDQNHLAPDTVLTSFVLDMEKAYDNAVKMVRDGTFRGEIFKPGLEMGKSAPGDGIIYLASFHSLDKEVPPEVKEQVSQAAEDIIEGRMIVPERYEIS